MEPHMAKLYNSFIFGTLVAIVVLGFLQLQKQKYAQFFEQDPSISYYKLNGDIVSTEALWAITVPISSCSVIISYWFPMHEPENGTKMNRIMKVIIFALGLFTSAVVTQIVTYAIKTSVGRPRPMALYGCNYMGYKTAVESGNFTQYYLNTQFARVGDVANCYASNEKEDMWSSFPSGHASLSFATLLYAYFMLARVLSIEKNIYLSWQNLIAFGPVVIAAWVSVTRVIDFKHHVDDVIAGALIGSVCAYLCYQTASTLVQQVIAGRTTGSGRNGGSPVGEIESTERRSVSIV